HTGAVGAASSRANIQKNSALKGSQKRDAGSIAVFRLLAARGPLEDVLQLRHEVLVAVLRVAGEVLLELGKALEELGQLLGSDLLGVEAVTLFLQIARVEDLLELLRHRLGEH